MIRKLLLLSVLLSVLLFVNCQEDDFSQEQNEPTSVSKLAVSHVKPNPRLEKYANETIRLVDTKQEAFELCTKVTAFDVWSLATIIYNNTDKNLSFKKRIGWGNTFFFNTSPQNIPPKKYGIIISGTKLALRKGVYDEFVYTHENTTVCFGSYLPYWWLGMSGRSSNVLVNFSEFNNDELNYHSRPTMTKRMGNLEISGKITPLSYGPHYAEFTISSLSNLNTLNSSNYITNDYETARKMIDGLKAAYGTGLTAKIIIHNKTDKNLRLQSKNTWYNSGFFTEPPSIIPPNKYGVVLAKHASKQATGVYNQLTYKWNNKRDVSFGTYVPWSWAYTNNVLVDHKKIDYNNLYYNSKRPWIDKWSNGLRLTGYIDKGNSPYVHFTVER